MALRDPRSAIVLMGAWPGLPAPAGYTRSLAAAGPGHGPWDGDR